MRKRVKNRKAKELKLGVTQLKPGDIMELTCILKKIKGGCRVVAVEVK